MARFKNRKRKRGVFDLIIIRRRSLTARRRRRHRRRRRQPARVEAALTTIGDAAWRQSVACSLAAAAATAD